MLVANLKRRKLSDNLVFAISIQTATTAPFFDRPIKIIRGGERYAHNSFQEIQSANILPFPFSYA